jgi:hypothetical protein
MRRVLFHLFPARAQVTHSEHPNKRSFPAWNRFFTASGPAKLVCLSNYKTLFSAII